MGQYRGLTFIRLNTPRMAPSPTSTPDVDPKETETNFIKEDGWNDSDSIEGNDAVPVTMSKRAWCRRLRSYTLPERRKLLFSAFTQKGIENSITFEDAYSSAPCAAHE